MQAIAHFTTSFPNHSSHTHTHLLDLTYMGGPWY
jgi:hypothetical protein